MAALLAEAKVGLWAVVRNGTKSLGLYSRPDALHQHPPISDSISTAVQQPVPIGQAER